MPTSAGVYHWSAALAGPKHSRIIGFMTGYFNVLGWTLGLASLFAVTGLEITGLYSLWHPEYESKTWHVFVVFVVLNWLFAGFIQFGNRFLPLYNKIGRGGRPDIFGLEWWANIDSFLQYRGLVSRRHLPCIDPVDPFYQRLRMDRLQ